MAAAGVRNHMIITSFIGKYGWYSKVGFTRKDLYTMCCREKRKLLVDSDAITTIGMIESIEKRYLTSFSITILTIKAV
jgi:hypothetical protein